MPSASTVDFLREWAEPAVQWLRVRRDVVNSLNIFPVPDGDTGNNMLHTADAARAALDTEPDDLEAVCDRVIEKALWGARGNSGVILANFLKGFLDRLRHVASDMPGAEDWRDAVTAGSDAAWRSTVDPVDGTILTLLREVAAAVSDALSSNPTPTSDAFLPSLLERARAALEATMDQLDVLRAAGVVDAGACGVFFLIEGMLRHARGQAVDTTARGDGYQPDLGSDTDVWRADVDARFCLEVTLRATERKNAILECLAAFGQSEVAIGSGDLLKVHLHTDDPDAAVAAVREYTEVLDVYKENMVQQQYRLLAERQHTTDGYPGVVAVAAGGGMVEIFRELGADAVVDGGPTLNPSVEELVHGCRAAGKADLILLPNNRDVLPAAREASQLVEANVVIVETASMVEGIAGIMNYTRSRSAEANRDAMLEGIRSVAWGFVTRAERDARDVRRGEYVCGRGRDLFGSGSLEQATARLLEQLDVDVDTLVSVYTGADADDEDTETVRRAHEARAPGGDLEVIYGGQPHYRFLISAE